MSNGTRVVCGLLILFMIVTIFGTALILSGSHQTVAAESSSTLHTSTVVWRVSESGESTVFALSITLTPEPQYFHPEPVQIGEHTTRALRQWSEGHQSCALGDPTMVSRPSGGGNSFGSFGVYVLVRCLKPFSADLENALTP